MNVDRRTFLQWGAAGSFAAAAGCGRLPGVGAASPSSGPFQAPDVGEIDPVTHALNRLTFGARPGDYQRVRALGKTGEEAFEAFVREQLHPERIDDSFCDGVVRRLETLRLPLRQLFEYKEKFLRRELVAGTILRAVHSRRQLFEVMVQFWTDHFNIAPGKGDSKWLKTWDDREVIRRHALGGWRGQSGSWLAGLVFGGASPGDAERGKLRFRDMVKASALSPAMLWYLDGRQNRFRESGDKPNENYARELLELHTLGVHGGYTQRDVMEVARCLTGWFVFDHDRAFKNGRVVFQRRLHDDGEKLVLGHLIPAGLGEGDLERLLDIVCGHPSTARHIATKLCRRFIGDDPPDDAVAATANAFSKSDGEIRETLGVLFRTEAFRGSRGTKFKRPFHFVVSALRAADARVPVEGLPAIYDHLLRMGHAPFNYPTPDGYPEEAGPWMGTLLWRWNFAQALSRNQAGKGIRVDQRALAERAGGKQAAMAHVLGRLPSKAEQAAATASGNPLALLLASPAFQWS